MFRLLLALCLLALSACQSSPLIELDYQPERDYYTAQRWQWAEPAVQFLPNSADHSSDLDAQRVRAAIAQQLTQHGLYYSDSAPDIQVRAWLITETQQQHTQVLQNDYWGGIWGPGIQVQSYDSTYTEQKLQVDILDHHTQQLIWRGSTSRVLPKQRTRPDVRAAQLQQQVQAILQHFPPR